MEITVSLSGLDTTCNVEDFNSHPPPFYCILSISHSQWPSSYTSFIWLFIWACCSHYAMTLLCQHLWMQREALIDSSNGRLWIRWFLTDLVLIFPLPPRGNRQPRGASRVTTSSWCMDDPITHSPTLPLPHSHSTHFLFLPLAHSARHTPCLIQWQRSARHLGELMHTVTDHMRSLI